MKKGKINILHIVTSFEDGGLEKIVSLLVNNIKNENIQHYVASLMKSKSEYLLEDLIGSNAVLVKFEFHNRIKNIKSILINIKGSFQLAYFLRKNEIDIVHSHDFFPAFIARVSSLLAQIFMFYKIKKIFITLHNSFFWLNRFHHSINKLLSYYTTLIICVSNSVMNYSIEHDRIKKCKYKIILNGVNTGQYSPKNEFNVQYRREFKFGEKDIVLGNVGVLSVRKGQKYLIEAFNRLLKKRKNLKLLIFGSEREHEIDIAKNIYAMINKYNLNEKVRIIQPRKDLNLIYNIFDVYVMPSITEGLSLSAMEAMLMERVCLFSDIPPFKEMVEDKKNGFLFESENIDDLYSKLDYILSDLESIKSVGKKAREIAVEKYDVRKMCSEYEKLYLS